MFHADAVAFCCFQVKLVNVMYLHVIFWFCFCDLFEVPCYRTVFAPMIFCLVRFSSGPNHRVTNGCYIANCDAW